MNQKCGFDCLGTREPTVGGNCGISFRVSHPNSFSHSPSCIPLCIPEAFKTPFNHPFSSRFFNYLLQRTVFGKIILKLKMESYIPNSKVFSCGIFRGANFSGVLECSLLEKRSLILQQRLRVLPSLNQMASCQFKRRS